MELLISSARTLRAWQERAIKTWCDARFQGIVEVATAGGKTFFAIECMKIWLRSHQKSKVLILVPTTALQDQWLASLSIDHSIPENEICLWPEDQDLNKQFHIMVINSARTKAKYLSNLDPNLLLIADECHRYASAENSSALRIPKGSSLGLTATAKRDFDDGLAMILIPTLGPVIYEYTIADARQDHVVAQFEIRNVKAMFEPLELEDYSKLTKRLAQAIAVGDEDKIKRIAMMRAQVSRNASRRIPIAASIVEEHRGKRIIVFHEEIARAETIVDLLQSRGHSVAIYHSQMSSDRRRENLKQYRKGIIEILVCCRALDEGVDVPESEVAVIVASTSSSRQRIQRMGRVIRLHNDKEVALIYTIYVTDRELSRLQEEERNLREIAQVKWFEVGTK